MKHRIDQLKDIVMYGSQKAKAKWEIEDDFMELSKWCAEQNQKNKYDRETRRY